MESENIAARHAFENFTSGDICSNNYEDVLVFLVYVVILSNLKI